MGKPWAARALTTASQPRSRVLIRSLSSSFSRSRSRSMAARRSSSELMTGIICGVGIMAVGMLRRGIWRAGGGPCGAVGRPARNRRFSSSSSVTRRSSHENWAFRRSRLFCAAILLRCARASLRSSEDISDRERLRGGWPLMSGRGCVDVEGEGEGESQDGDGEWRLINDIFCGRRQRRFERNTKLLTFGYGCSKERGGRVRNWRYCAGAGRTTWRS